MFKNSWHIIINLIISLDPAGLTGNYMRLAFCILLFAILLSVNYFMGWSYDHVPEDASIKNDSVKLMISHRYARMNPLKWLVLGRNYRREWSTPVRLPVFHINSLKGGFRIIRLGGGEQTKSLHLVDSAGTKWVLRMIDKDVRSVMPVNFRNSFCTSIVQDHISAAYPYAPLTIADLSAAAEVPAEASELFFIPDDTLLGKFHSLFRNQACFLEKEMQASNTRFRINTLEVRDRLLATDSCRVSQERVLKARLLDMLIADWDRHDRQWDWSWQDSGGVRYFYPIPEDRDQAYFNPTGLLAAVIRVVGMPQLIGFREQSDRLVELNHKTYTFDRFFLNALSGADWERIIGEFTQNISDEVIHRAVKRLPYEIYALSGPELERKLKIRRDGLPKNGQDYYKYIASIVPVHTTRLPETIHIRQYTDRLELNITGQAGSQPYYNRVLYPSETKEVILEDLGPEDSFNIENKGSSGIRLVFNGRDGKPFPLADIRQANGTLTIYEPIH